MTNILDKIKKLPLELENKIFYYLPPSHPIAQFFSVFCDQICKDSSHLFQKNTLLVPRKQYIYSLGRESVTRRPFKCDYTYKFTFAVMLDRYNRNIGNFKVKA